MCKNYIAFSRVICDHVMRVNYIRSLIKMITLILHTQYVYCACLLKIPLVHFLGFSLLPLDLQLSEQLHGLFMHSLPELGEEKKKRGGHCFARCHGDQSALTIPS